MATLASSPNAFSVPGLRRPADSNCASRSRYALKISAATTCSACGRRALFKRISSLRSAVPALRDVNAGVQDGNEHILDVNYAEYEIQQRLNSDAERDGQYLEFEIEQRLRRDIGPAWLHNPEELEARFEEQEGPECVKDDQNQEGHFELPASLQIVENLRKIKAPQVQKDMQMEESETKFEKVLKHLKPQSAPNPNNLPNKQRSKPSDAISKSRKLLPTMDATWSTPDHPVANPASSSIFKQVMKKPLPPGAPTKFYLAELALSDAELRRLNRAPEASLYIYQKVTSVEIRVIRRRWATCEIVRIWTSEHINMDRLHEELEVKTGGLVIRRHLRWLKLYRGRNYCADHFHSGTESVPGDFITESLRTEENVFRDLCVDSDYLMAMDKMLEGLGPRYADWQGCSPVPVDGDELPQVDFTFKAPYRLFPHSRKAELNRREAERLRRLHQAMPPQFVIGRSNGLLQGLANAILKLWEKVEVVRVAFKCLPEKAELERTVHQLELLTGGCNIYHQGVILLYRGKDFLPAPIATAIEERDSIFWDRRKDLPASNIHADVDLSVQEDQAPKVSKNNIERRLRRLGRDLDTVLEDKANFEKDLKWLAEHEQLRERSEDRETITEEERHIFKEIGLHSRQHILIGLGGVFAGTVKVMHEVWRYNEVIKFVYNGGKGDSHVQEIASFLEIESGGILIGIFPMVIGPGPALIFYRGKNYIPPFDLWPKHLLRKREAHDRTRNEAAIEGCNNRILELEAEIYSLRQKLLDTDEETSRQHDAGTIVELGAIIRTEPLTTTQRLTLRKRALAMGLIGRAQFSFGKGRFVRRIIRAIRLHLTSHELVTVKKPSFKWFSLVKLIEKDTGAAFVCAEQDNLLFYYNPLQGQLVSAVKEDSFPDTSSVNQQYTESLGESSEVQEITYKEVS